MSEKAERRRRRKQNQKNRENQIKEKQDNTIIIYNGAGKVIYRNRPLEIGDDIYFDGCRVVDITEEMIFFRERNNEEGHTQNCDKYKNIYSIFNDSINICKLDDNTIEISENLNIESDRQIETDKAFQNIQHEIEKRREDQDELKKDVSIIQQKIIDEIDDDSQNQVDLMDYLKTIGNHNREIIKLRSKKVQYYYGTDITKKVIILKLNEPTWCNWVDSKYPIFYRNKPFQRSEPQNITTRTTKRICTTLSEIDKNNQ